MHVADRGRREAQVLFALLAIAVLVFGIVTVVTGGDEEAGQTSSAPILEPMPTAPEARWTVNAASVFGNEFRDAGVYILAADHDAVIVKATQTAIGKPSALQALDPDTGRPLWGTPRIGWDDWCALSGAGQLACTRRVRADGSVANRMSFINPRTGAEEATALIRTAGSVTALTGVEDGFLVETNDIESVVIPEEFSDSDPEVEYRLEVIDDPPDRQMTITKFDSQCHQAWSIQPPINHDRAVVSDAGNLFAVSDTTRGDFTVYQLDTGKRVFSRFDSESGTPPDAAVLHPSGFVTSRSDPGDNRIEFFDADGARTGELAGWRVVPGDFQQITTVDDDELAVSSGSAVGIASIRDRAMRWDTGMSKHSLELLDDRYVAIESDNYAQGRTGTWTVLDAQTGEQQGQATIGYGQRYLGFDGTRLLFDGEPTANHRPNLPILSAYDAKTGKQSWRLPAPTDTAQWQVTGPYLLLIDYTPDFVSRSIARYAP